MINSKIKIISVFLSLCILLSLAGCKKTIDTESSQAPSVVSKTDVSSKEKETSSLQSSSTETVFSDSSKNTSTESSKPESDKDASTNSTTESATESSKPVPIPSKAEELISTMSLEDKVAQLFFVNPEAISDSSVSYSGGGFPYNIGGVIFFASNIQNPAQCKSFIDNLQNAAKTPLFIGVDEEGGSVSRIASNSSMGTTVFPNMAEILTEDAAYNVGKTIGNEIKQFGFNLDFAPVADVNSNPNNPVIGVRSFGSDPVFVAKQVDAAIRGFKASNILCTIKHFPGHGDTSADSHNGYTQLSKSLEELEKTEFVPFVSGINAGVEFVMVGHISVPGVTGDNLPATLSPKMIEILKKDLGFKGLVITDSMVMKAITNSYSASEAAVMAIEAGIDIILMPQDLGAAINGILDAIASGRITEERINQSVLKILETKVSKGIIK